MHGRGDSEENCVVVGVPATKLKHSDLMPNIHFSTKPLLRLEYELYRSKYCKSTAHMVDPFFRRDEWHPYV